MRFAVSSKAYLTVMRDGESAFVILNLLAGEKEMVLTLRPSAFCTDGALPSEGELLAVAKQIALAMEQP